jgi:peptide deformylase
MAVRSIVVWPDPRLREKTRAVAEVTDEIRALYRDMVDSMYAYDGVGLAAVQLGVPVKMFIVDSQVAGGGKGDPVAFINPQIVELSADKEKMEEGCLSFPGIFLAIERPRRARVRAMGLDGQMFEAEGDGLFGRALQHENDHLTGKLMLDFVGPLKKRQIKKKLERLHDDEPGAGHVHDESCDHDHEQEHEHARGGA